MPDALRQLEAYGSGKQEVARGPVRIPDRWVPGYVNEITGEIISYPSAYPGQTRALLTRATDGAMRIEWEAASPPEGAPSDIVAFVWHAGLASGYGAHRFTLSLNGTPCATFTSGRDTNDREWTVKGERDVSLSFKTTQIGNFNELFGLMILSAPRSLLGPGRPRFSVVGEAARNQDYYMTFLRPVEDWARVAAEEAVLKGGQRALRVEVSHIGNQSPARLLSDGAALWTGQVGSGYTSLFLPAPARAQLPLALDVGGRQVFAGTLALGDPVRPWEIHLLPHSHVDIGYSDPQPQVERKQWKNLADAVALAAKTATYPPGARFKWNVEGLWSVESYLHQAPAAERAAFVAAVKAGAIGLQANYTNILTGLASPEELSHWTDAARRLRAEYGLPPMLSAMHTDIPGLSWTSVRALAEGGVRYFSSGPNYMPSLPDQGDRIGHTLNALGDRPFWWTSPSGNERVLFWMAGRGYSWFHGLNMGAAFRAGRMPLLDYVSALKANGYPWEMVQIRYTIGGDNGPVDPQLPDFVKSWNETFEWPRLVINTADAMFAEFERRHGGALPTLSGDMTPYWEDGAISTAGEEALVRASARRLVQAETIWALRDPARFPEGDAAEAWRNVLLWHEHTWGAADSISDPDRADVVAQWNYKRQFALEAGKRSQALLDSALASPRGTAGSEAPVFVDVINTLSWSRKGLVVLDAALTEGRDRVSEASGRPLPSQRLGDARLAVLVDRVPPFGSIRLKIERGASTSPRSWSARVNGTTVLRNDFLQISLDEKSGDIASLQQLMESHLPAATAPALFEPRIGQGPIAMAMFDTKKPPEFALANGGLNRYIYVPGRNPQDGQAGSRVRIAIEERGPLVATLRVESDVPGARSLVRRVTLVAGEPTVQIEDRLDKTPVRTKESAHVAFPFDLPGARVRVDEGGAIVVPDGNQLDGSCRDFIGAHSAVDIANGTRGVAVVTVDAPLLELGAITDERQDPKTRVRQWRTATGAGATVYAYLLNNYWHTNYKADQEGLLTYRFVLRPHVSATPTVSTQQPAGSSKGVAADVFDAAHLRRLGADCEQPLIARPVTSQTAAIRAPFRVDSPEALVSSIRLERPGGPFLLRLYNPSERPARARIIAVPAGSVIRVEVAEGDQKTTKMTNGTVVLRPFATAIVRVVRSAAEVRKSHD